MKDDPNPQKHQAVLSDHKRIGKTLVPIPATYGWTHVNFVQRIFPEIIWIGFLLERCGAKRGIELGANLVGLQEGLESFARKRPAVPLPTGFSGQ